MIDGYDLDFLENNLKNIESFVLNFNRNNRKLYNHYSWMLLDYSLSYLIEKDYQNNFRKLL